MSHIDRALAMSASGTTGVLDFSDTNADDQHIHSLLIAAISSDDLETFKTLLADPAVNIAGHRFDGDQNCLHLAIKSGANSIALYLLTELSRDSVNQLLSSRDADRHTPLMYAVQVKTPDWVLIPALLEAGVQEGLSDALLLAAKSGRPRLVGTLMTAGARDEDFKALEHAAKNGYTATIKVLVKTDALQFTHKVLIKKSLAQEVLAWMNTGKYGDALASALIHAVSHGHEDTAKVLTDAHSSPSAALAMVLSQLDMDVAARGKAVTYLLSQGATASQALDYSLKTKTFFSLPTLVLLGLDDTARLSWALNNDPQQLQHLLQSGAKYDPLLITLAKKNATHALEKFRRMISALRLGPTEAGILYFARHNNLAALEALAPLAGRFRSWQSLAESGAVDAISVLLRLKLLDDDDGLRSFVRNLHLSALRTAIRAGCRAEGILLIVSAADRFPQKKEFLELCRKRMKLLLIAGANAAPLSDSLRVQLEEEIHLQRQRYASLSNTERHEQLSEAASQGQVLDVALLLEQETDPLAVMKGMSTTELHSSIYHLIRGGMDPFEMLIRCLKANDIEFAVALKTAIMAQTELSSHTAEDLTTRLLIRALDDPELSITTIIPALSSGADALVHFALSMDEAAARKLLTAGADGPGALFWLLRRSCVAAARKLLAWGVDRHQTLRLTFQPDLAPANNLAEIRERLLLVGADRSVALWQALERSDKAAAVGLVEADPSVGKEVALRLLRDKTLTDDIRDSRLRFLHMAGFDADEVLETLARNNEDAGALKRLVASGKHPTLLGAPPGV
ncbi:ankyrin repeat domain-containing protein [Bordetella sp. 02P26C-1]|uniref:ankyrin repeat domain-containing protein n=1 Tax=Bordetella sp. 02P26C-1 TaxID=2683195 RepID=UPI00135420DD|nr:ankyrin repeat domain-containing protein [Bordetella sp. 02P26C-1]MVW78354.1 hypothetical protein [Bordetella sp. 02P26C-1]